MSTCTFFPWQSKIATVNGRSTLLILPAGCKQHRQNLPRLTCGPVSNAFSGAGAKRNVGIWVVADLPIACHKPVRNKILHNKLGNISPRRFVVCLFWNRTQEICCGADFNFSMQDTLYALDCSASQALQLRAYVQMVWSSWRKQHCCCSRHYQVR